MNPSLTEHRKAELFDRLLKNTHSPLSDCSWSDIFQSIGMSDEEMVISGLELPELKVNDTVLEEMGNHVAQVIGSYVLDAAQTHITISLTELTAMFGLDPTSCELAEEMFLEELYTHDEVEEAEFTGSQLSIKPNEQAIRRKIELEPDLEMTMQ